jgi:hypothetical protein
MKESHQLTLLTIEPSFHMWSSVELLFCSPLLREVPSSDFIVEQNQCAQASMLSGL